MWKKGVQLNGVPRIVGINNLSIGHDISFNDNVFIHAGGMVKIGDKVTLSHGVSILSVGLDTLNYSENAQKKYRDHITKSVSIGEGTWLAANVTVCPGVSIADNCIVAAGAVVASDLKKSNSLYAGVPAKLIK
jgi:maltose O-acetyltransferase